MKYLMYQKVARFGKTKKIILVNEQLRIKRYVLEAQGYRWVGEMDCEIPYKEIIEGFQTLAPTTLFTGGVRNENY